MTDNETQAVSEEPDVIDVEAGERFGDTPLARIETDLAVMQAKINAQLVASQAMLQFQTEIRKMVVAAARPQHWKRFGDRIRPDGSECLRLRMLLGVGMDIKPPTREEYTDTEGQYYVYWTSGRVWFGPEDAPVIVVPCYGSASSRTPFFAKSSSGWRKLNEVNPSFISKMAWTEAIKNGIVMLFGLDLVPGELAIEGTKVEDTAGRFQPKDHSKEDDDETAQHRSAIRARILELCQDDAAMASGWLEDMTTFKGDKGLVKGKKNTAELTAKQVANLFKRMDTDLTSGKLSAFVDRQAAERDAKKTR